MGTGALELGAGHWALELEMGTRSWKPGVRFWFAGSRVLGIESQALRAGR